MRTSLLALTVLLSGCAALPAGLPNISEETLKSLSRVGTASLSIGPETERQIGRGIAAVVLGRYPLLDAPALNEYVNLVGHTVAEHSVRAGEIAFHFGVVDTEDVNAFAAPGGYVLVTRGALLRMQDEAELAGVLAHEIAHVDQKHVLNEIRRSSVLQSVREETDFDGELLNRVADYGSGVLFSGLSRSDEMDSDSLAILYLTAAGYRPAGLLRFVEGLGGVEEVSSNPLRELRATHPPPTDRFSALVRQLERAALPPDAGAALPERFRENVRTARR